MWLIFNHTDAKYCFNTYAKLKGNHDAINMTGAAVITMYQKSMILGAS